MAIQAASFRHWIVYKFFRIHRLVTHTAQGCALLEETEFVLWTGERCMTYGALPYDEGAVKVFMLDNGHMALGRHAALEGVRMGFLLSGFVRRRMDRHAKKSA